MDEAVSVACCLWWWWWLFLLLLLLLKYNFPLTNLNDLSSPPQDALCSRIGIMSHGRLRCVGENLHLKNIYGSGYKIDIRYQEGKENNVIAYMDKILPDASLVLGGAHAGTFEYQIDKGKVQLSTMMRQLNESSIDVGILDYGIRQTSLEEVFLKIARESEAAFEAERKK
jgi:hypothetical protein